MWITLILFLWMSFIIGGYVFFVQKYDDGGDLGIVALAIMLLPFWPFLMLYFTLKSKFKKVFKR